MSLCKVVCYCTVTFCAQVQAQVRTCLGADEDPVSMRSICVGQLVSKPQPNVINLIPDPEAFVLFDVSVPNGSKQKFKAYVQAPECMGSEFFEVVAQHLWIWKTVLTFDLTIPDYKQDENGDPAQDLEYTGMLEYKQRGQDHLYSESHSARERGMLRGMMRGAVRAAA